MLSENFSRFRGAELSWIFAIVLAGLGIASVAEIAGSYDTPRPEFINTPFYHGWWIAPLKAATTGFDWTLFISVLIPTLITLSSFVFVALARRKTEQQLGNNHFDRQEF